MSDGADKTTTTAKLQKNASFNLGLDPFQKDDFFEQIGLDPCRDLRNTTDDLSIKFFEGAEGFPPFEDASEQTALGFPERREMDAPARSFSLVMEAFDQDQSGAGPSHDHANFMPAKHMEILCNSDAPPPSIRELYGKYGAAQASALRSVAQHEKPARIPSVPPNQVAELVTTMRKSGSCASAQKRKSSHRNAAEKRVKEPTSVTEMMAKSYERSMSIGTRILRALERTNKKNESPAATRKAARQKARAAKAQKAATSLPSMANDLGAEGLAAQMYMDMELLVQQTKAVIDENENLKTKLDMMSRLSSAQASKIEEESRNA